MEKVHEPEWFIKARNVIYYVLSVIEVILAFRLIFKLLGANPRNGFVSFLYTLTSVFVAPFNGIFAPFVTESAATAFVVEPSTIIAMIVYAIIARGIINLIKLKLSGNEKEGEQG